MATMVTRGLKVALIICVGTLLGACRGDDDASKERMETVPVDSAPPTAIPGGMSDTTSATAPADTMGSAGAMAMSDANILAVMGMSDSSEIAQAKLVQGKTKNADVKKFAGMMVTDHTRMMKEGKDLATKLNIAPAPPPTIDLKAETDMAMQQLQSATAGTDLESKYVTQAVMDHQKTLDRLNQAKGQAKSEELRALIDKAIPVVQQHLQHAQEMQNKMSGAGGGTSGGASGGAGDTTHKM